MSEPRRIKKIIRNHAPNIPTGNAKRVAVDPSTGAPEYTPHTVPRVIDGFITLSQLAMARKIQAQLARLWLKKAGVKKPAGGWLWKEGSKELAKIRRILKLDIDV